MQKKVAKREESALVKVGLTLRRIKLRQVETSLLLVLLAVLLLLALLLSFPAVAGAEVASPHLGRALRHDVSRPLAELAREAEKSAGGPYEMPMMEPPPRNTITEPIEVPDLLRQSADRPLPEASRTPLPEVDFAGLSDDDNALLLGARIVPPDTQGDVGVDFYVQWINLIFAVFDKDGSHCGAPGCVPPGGGPFAGNALWNGFGGPCEANNDGDPIVIYDHLAGRWLLSQFSINEGIQCVALSRTGDPRGAYDRWAFEVSPGEHNDYPKIGLMPDAYYLSLRDFPSVPDLSSAVALDRRAMLAGDPGARFIKFSLPCLLGNCADGIQPPHLEGPAPPEGTPGIFSKVWDDDFEGPWTGVDGYRLWEFVPDWSEPARSTLTELPIVPASGDFSSNMCGFFYRDCIPQASASQRLDPIDELQMYRAQYRHHEGHDSLLVNTTVDATGTDVAGVRWAELRRASGRWSLHQEGTYAPDDGENRFMGSIAMDGAGNIALGYSVSSAATDPSIRYTVRYASDPPGILPGGEVEIIAGTGAQIDAARWGDYSSMSVDPVDDCTFWYTQEYYETTASFDFKTRIAAFKVPGCGAAPAICGNGVREEGEVCDGADFGEATCNDFGCGGGELLCGADCRSVDTASCTDCNEVCNYNGVCEFGEDCESCGDCPAGISPGAYCGNGVCETQNGESCLSCPADCRGRQGGRPSNRFCCGDGNTGIGAVDCTDDRCHKGRYDCTDDPVFSESYCCGDLSCDAGESCSTCALDCTIGAELCSGGIDEDCDGAIDCEDADCLGDLNSCPTCRPRNARCTTHLDCCSEKCRSNGRCR